MSLFAESALPGLPQSLRINCNVCYCFCYKVLYKMRQKMPKEAPVEPINDLVQSYGFANLS